MQGIGPADGLHDSDSSGSIPTLICPPPSADLANWLFVRTPLGAPYLSVGGDLPLPLVAAAPQLLGLTWGGPALKPDDPRRPRLSAAQRAAARCSFVSDVLRANGVPDADVPPMVEILAPEPIRETTTLPMFVRQKMPGIPNTLAQRARHPRGGAKKLLAISAAVQHDVEGRADAELAEWLELDDHRMPDLAGGFFVVRSRGLQRHLREGRLLLNRLGAWPWALAPHGRLPKDWWLSHDFLYPLTCWHWAAWLEMHFLTLRALPAAANLPITPEETAAAERIYLAALAAQPTSSSWDRDGTEGSGSERSRAA